LTIQPSTALARDLGIRYQAGKRHRHPTQSTSQPSICGRPNGLPISRAIDQERHRAESSFQKRYDLDRRAAASATWACSAAAVRSDIQMPGDSIEHAQ